jgi:sugar phosphate isomerase/epimerase
MDLGISLATFHGFSLDEALAAYQRLADRFGLTAIEFNLQVRPGPASQWPWDVPIEKLKPLAGRFRHRGTHLPFIDLDPIAANAGIREESRKQLRLAIENSGRMEMSYAVVHASGGRSSPPWSQEKTLWLDVFGDLAERAATEGLMLCIENGARLVRLDRLLEVLETLDRDNLCLCIDIGHAYQRLLDQGSIAARLLPRLDERWKRSFGISRLMPFEPYGSLADFLRSAEERVHVFHLHDRKGKRDHLPLGRGAIDLDSVAPFLKRRAVILEIPLRTEDDFAREIGLAREMVDGAGERP